jgi:hypothetical protein
VPQHHVADRRRIGAHTQHAQGLGGAPSYQRIRIGKGSKQRSAGRGVADKAKRKRRHLAHFWFWVRTQQLRQGLNRIAQANTAEREGGATSDARLRVAEQANEVRGGRGRDYGWLSARRGNENGWRGRVRIAQQTLVFKPQDPSELLFPRDDRRCDGN